MGRRPHALIQEFFDRGPKLDNNSNRYQHTCKRCSEAFPKGRVDSLTTHLLRRCPNLTERDRTWVFQQLQADVGKSSRPAKRSHAETLQDTSLDEGSQYHADPPLPAVQQQQSALETLAEVSGQHSSRAGVSDAHHGGSGPPNRTNIVEAIAEQALLAQLQPHIETNDNVPALTTALNHFAYQATSRPTQLQSQQQAQLSDNPAPISASPLVEAASAASRHLEHGQSSQPFRDPQRGNVNGSMYQSFNLPIDMGFRMGESATDPDMPWAQPAVSSPMPSFGSVTIPQTELITGYGILSNNPRQKPRGRFDDVRRKEVSNMRKQGACIRCRMLKKPCSGDTPCKTCASVESARIWKGKCVRTRLSDEMDLWSGKLFDARARAKLTATTGPSGSDESSGFVEVTFSNSCEKINLPAKAAKNSKADRSGASEKQEEAQANIVWHLEEDATAEDSLARHARSYIPHFFEEQPALMRDVVKRTQHLLRTKRSDPATNDTKEGRQEDTRRSSFAAQNDLLGNVLELWALTEILTSECAVEISLGDPNGTQASDGAPSHPISLAQDSASHQVIRAQLQAVMESRCSKLSKTILNEIERRLLQRQQTSRFGTFLSSLVFLSCVERMAGFYRCLDQANGANSANTAAPTPWPPENPPYHQVETFADLLTSLLRMRALPPKTKITPEGRLQSLRDFGMFAPQTTPGQQPPPTMKTAAEEEGKEAAADWLDALGLRAEPLRAKRDAEVPGPGDGMEAWRLRYVARVLLPEGPR